MSLRSQLEELLPELLPSDPAQAIKGTELIRLVRLRLGEEYSDASLRYHFSFMASEPDSEIAKVELARQGAGPGRAPVRYHGPRRFLVQFQ